MSTEKPYKTDKLLSRGQCRDVICDEMDCASTIYYEEYYPHIYFKSYSSSGKRKIEMPYGILMGIVHVMKGVYSKDDPPREILEEFADLAALEPKSMKETGS